MTRAPRILSKPSRTGRRGGRAALVQATLATLVLAAVTLTPAASGAMLLVPLDFGRTGSTVNAALVRHARLLGAGPLPGSVVVRGRREALADLPWREAILVVAASPATCGPLYAIDERTDR